MAELVRRLEAVHVVRTPEYVEFEYPVAGLMSRYLAWLIDALIAFSLTGATILVIWLFGFWIPGFAVALTFIALFMGNWGYFMLSEYFLAGQTVGKRALGLRVIQETGVRLGFYQAATRNLVRAIDHMPVLYLVGGSAMALSPRARRLGDLAAGTLVVRDRRRRIPSGIERPADAIALLGGDKRLEERVRRATVDEREILLSAALRRDELAVSARLTLFPKLARLAEGRLGLTKPEHLSDEKFVVAVAALLIGAESSR